MSEVSSFMKDARQYLFPRRRDVNETKEDRALKKSNEGGEKGAVDEKNPSTPLPDGQSFIQPKV
ncbi:unnamed protein product [Prunus armeniaca]